MTQDLLWTYAFNIIINSFLAFLTIAFSIQLLIFIFRVKQPRFKAILLYIPLVKLAFDPFLYDFQNWALTHQINPIEAETGSRALSLLICCPTTIADLIPLTTAVRLSINADQTFTLADVAALSIGPVITKGIVLFMGTVSLILFAAFLFRLGRSLMVLSHIRQHATPYKKPLQNRQLLRKMKQANSQLIISSEIETPCAFGIFNKKICFPSQLVYRLSQDEFEAIIAHELDHVCWNDGMIRLLSHFFCTLFWWVPTGWWLNLIESTQEKACDAKVSQFNMLKLDLASAIIKTAKTAKSSSLSILFTCFIQDASILKRLQLLLKEPESKKGHFRWLQISLVAVIAISIFFGKFWIF